MVAQNKRTLKNYVKFVDNMEHSFNLSLEDYTIIINALHYYKKSEKRGKFTDFTEERVNQLRDKMAYQLIPSPNSKRGI